jgi:hypothetical protein
MTATPIDLFASSIHLLQGGRVHAEQRVFDPERDNWQLMAFRVETDADCHANQWEIHPNAEELVSCLTGGIRLYFRPEQPGEEEQEIKLAAGTAVIVPRGNGTASSWTPPATSWPLPRREAAVSSPPRTPPTSRPVGK